MIWWLDALKRTGKITRENALEQPELKFNPGLLLFVLNLIAFCFF